MRSGWQTAAASRTQSNTAEFVVLQAPSAVIAKRSTKLTLRHVGNETLAPGALIDTDLIAIQTDGNCYLMELYSELQQLIDSLRAERVAYALCGGFALAIYSIPRATEDIDLLIEEESLPKVRDIAGRLGFRFDPEPLVFR